MMIDVNAAITLLEKPKPAKDRFLFSSVKPTNRTNTKQNKNTLQSRNPATPISMVSGQKLSD